MVRLAVCLDPVRLDAVCLYAEIRPTFRTYSLNVLRLAVCLDLSGCSASVCCLSGKMCFWNDRAKMCPKGLPLRTVIRMKPFCSKL